jgi:hypothetical protein
MGLLLSSVTVVNAQRTVESRNMEMVGHNDLNGMGDGGEGLALQQLPDGRRSSTWVLDVSDFTKVSTARRLDDLSLSFFDTSGPDSRGVHNVWFVDGEFAHLTTGMADFRPTNPNDDQIYANDRFTGGLYILRYTGTVPVD